MSNAFNRISERLKIVKYDFNDIVFVIWILDELLPNSNETLNYEIVKDQLRSWVMQLSDALKFIGINVPIMVIVQYTEDKNDTWHEISGDQDWHRGDFAIIPCKNNIDANEMFQSVAKETFSFERYILHAISMDKVSQYLLDEINRIVSQNEDEKRLHVSLIKNISDHLKKGESTKKAFSFWESEIEKLISSKVSGGKNHV